MPVGWSRRLFLCISIWCFAIVGVSARAQDQLQTVEQLYFAAAYEEALAELARLERDAELYTPKAAEYTILSLLALGRVDAAQRELEKLLRRDTKYRPDPRQSPRLQEQFEIVRARLLPELIRTAYADAKALLSARKYEEAAARFSEVLELSRYADDAAFAETRALATLFLDFVSLASKADAESRPVGTTGQSAQAGSHETVYDILSADVQPPTALVPLLPPTSPAASVPRTPGLFEIVIDGSGRVESTSVLRSIDPQYDQFVTDEARKWRFKPATRNGRPVRFRKMLEIYAVTSPQPTR